MHAAMKYSAPKSAPQCCSVLLRKHTLCRRLRLFYPHGRRRVRGVLCLTPIGRLACTTTPSSRSFYSALRSIRQSNNVDESCIKDGPDAAVRAIRVIGLASRNATRLSSSPLRCAGLCRGLIAWPPRVSPARPQEGICALTLISRPQASPARGDARRDRGNRFSIHRPAR
jgi:hypothetical protein